MFDIDGVWVEAKHPYDRPPVALVEVAEVSGRLGSLDNHSKSGRVMMQLGRAANVPVFLILYKCSRRPNPAKPASRDIEEFYVKELFPVPSERWAVLTPAAMVEFELLLREEHIRVKRNGSQLPLIPHNLDQMLTDDDLKRRWYSATIMRLDHA